VEVVLRKLGKGGGMQVEVEYLRKEQFSGRKVLRKKVIVMDRRFRLAK